MVIQMSITEKIVSGDLIGLQAAVNANVVASTLLAVSQAKINQFIWVSTWESRSFLG